MPKVGIFWVYKNRLLGEACELDDGEVSSLGIIDSPISHYDWWEHNPAANKHFPELAHTEYQLIPRGRVVYHQQHSVAVMYADKTLHTEPTKVLIMDFFDLHGTTVAWKTDSHYVTQ